MKASSFDFVRPSSIQETTAILAQHQGDARVLAGGQSLGPMLNLRLARPSAVVDISALGELKTI
ncbi:FAD binding domain-containing protein, partial [Acinetobacter baumannii]